jgi:SAM-dependent methyltransferase
MGTHSHLLRRFAIATLLLGSGAGACCTGCYRADTSPAAQATQNEQRTMFSEGDAYERYMGRWSRLLAPSLVDFSQVHEGDAVLDVGSGTGALAFAVRDATKTARVTGIDPSPAYVAHATGKNTDPRIHFAIGDAQALGFSDAQFDRTMSLLVMNFIPDRERALQEMIRVTKPDGVVSAAVWDYGDGMQMLRIFWDEAVEFDAAAKARDEAHMPLCKKGELAAAWRQAGLHDVRETPLRATLRFSSFADYWEPFTLGQGPAGAYVMRLPKERQNELGQRLRRRLLDGQTDHPIELQASAWAVRGIKAPSDAGR